MPSEEQRQKDRERYQRNRDKVLARQRARRQRNHEQIKARERERYHERKAAGWKRPYTEKAREQKRLYYRANKGQIAPRRRLTAKAWAKCNRERVNEQSRLRRRNPEVRAKMNARNKARYQEDATYRLQRILRSRLTQALSDRQAFKWDTAFELLGCSVDDLIHHLESLWQPGMSWENYGREGWHIDHIVPCAAFDLTRPEEQAKCFHYTNLQPLWAQENLAKGAKVVPVAVCAVTMQHDAA